MLDSLNLVRRDDCHVAVAPTIAFTIVIFLISLCDDSVDQAAFRVSDIDNVVNEIENGPLLLVEARMNVVGRFVVVLL